MQQWEFWAINVDVDCGEGPFVFVPISGWGTEKYFFVTAERHKRIGKRVPEGGTVVALMFGGGKDKLTKWMQDNGERLNQVNMLTSIDEIPEHLKDPDKEFTVEKKKEEK